MASEEVRFYFSFRSPYAWLAFHRTAPALADLPVALKYIPVFPPPNFENDPARFPAKLEYMMEHDLPRLASSYGLPLSQAAQTDVEWIRPHAMWVYADDQGAGEAFGKELYRARFSTGGDLSDDGTYARIARDAGLDPEALVQAADDKRYQERVLVGMVGGLADGVFGVPLFVYRGERFFGHDRLPWLVRAIRVHCGMPTDPDMRWL